MLYFAIDQHSKQLTVNIRNEAGEICCRRQVSTRDDAPRAFFTQLAEQAGDEGYVAIVEVCGFNDWLLDLLRERGCREIVLVCAPRRDRHKTDRRDASKLGELLWVNRQRLLAGERLAGLRRVQVPTREQRDDRRLTTLRCQIARLRTRALNQIKHLLLARRLMEHVPTKGLQTQAARAWLRSLALDALDRLELDQLLARWELYDRQLAELEQQIRARQAAHATAAIVASIPGCAAYSSLAIAARIGDVRRFPTPRSLANYFGLTPTSRNSGDAQHRLGSISKAGSPLVRFLLGQLVLHVLRRDPHMRSWYQGLRRRRGAKIARVAVMRRLTVVLWHMLSKREAYQSGGPPRRRHAKQPEGAAVAAPPC
jgi:transposase